VQRLACQSHSRLPQPLPLLELPLPPARSTQLGRSTVNAVAAATSVAGVGSRERGRLS